MLPHTRHALKDTRKFPGSYRVASSKAHTSTAACSVFLGMRVAQGSLVCCQPWPHVCLLITIFSTARAQLPKPWARCARGARLVSKALLLCFTPAADVTHHAVWYHSTGCCYCKQASGIGQCGLIPLKNILHSRSVAHGLVFKVGSATRCNFPTHAFRIGAAHVVCEQVVAATTAAINSLLI